MTVPDSSVGQPRLPLCTGPAATGLRERRSLGGTACSREGSALLSSGSCAGQARRAGLGRGRHICSSAPPGRSRSSPRRRAFRCMPEPGGASRPSVRRRAGDTLSRGTRLVLRRALALLRSREATAQFRCPPGVSSPCPAPLDDSLPPPGSNAAAAAAAGRARPPLPALRPPPRRARSSPPAKCARAAAAAVVAAARREAAAAQRASGAAGTDGDAGRGRPTG